MYAFHERKESRAAHQSREDNFRYPFIVPDSGDIGGLFEILKLPQNFNCASGTRSRHVYENRLNVLTLLETRSNESAAKKRRAPMAFYFPPKVVSILNTSCLRLLAV